MPKSSKKKKEKRADFSKAKLKVGKQKVKPDNFTETSFKAKAISIPSQSINKSRHIKTADDEEQGDPREFIHFLALLSHKSGEIRKDALVGLASHLARHPPSRSTTVTPLVTAIAPLIVDDTRSVRKALLSLCENVLSILPDQVLSPHTPMFLLYISSAMTHIQPSIRSDSTKFLAWAMDATDATRLIVQSQLAKFMDNFETLLGWKRLNTNLDTTKALGTHLDVLCLLLRAALLVSPPEKAVPPTYDILKSDGAFVPHRSTLALLSFEIPFNIFKFSATSQRENEASALSAIDSNLSGLLLFLSNKFTDAVHGSREICVPILQMLQILVCVDAKPKECNKILRKMKQEIEGLKEVGGLGLGPILLAWSAISGKTTTS